MARLKLIEGPAGSGKSQSVQEMLANGEADVAADLTQLWAAVRGMSRDPVTGKYPVRTDADPAINSGLASYIKAAVVRQGLREGLNVVVTTASPNEVLRWEAVADELGAEFSHRRVDPGREAVEDSLRDPETGELSIECQRAIARWYDE